MTKNIADRITIQEFINALNTLTFEEVTKENLEKALPQADVDFVNEVEKELDWNMKDISIDDYIFTIVGGHDYSKEDILIGIPPQKPYVLSEYVEVYLPMKESRNNTHGSELQAEGHIEKNSIDKTFWLKIEFYTE